MIIQKGQKQVVERVSLLLLLVGAFLLFGLISLVNHERFLTFGWDLGFYDQIVWSFSRFLFPYSTFVDAPALGVRFSPILALIAPLYWLVPDARILLVVQALLATGAAFPLFLLGKRLAGSAYAGVVVMISYLSFVGLQRAVFFDFHPDTILPFLIGWALYFAHKGHIKLFLLFSCLMLLSKEWVGLLVAAMGVMFLLQGRRRMATLSIFLGISGFVMTVYVIVPAFGAKGPTMFDLGELGATPSDALVTLIQRPQLGFQKLITPPQKVGTIFGSFWPFAFLPLLAPETLVPIFTHFAIRFFDVSHRQSWTLLYHYSAPLTPLLTYGAIRGIHRINRIWPTHLLLATSILGLYFFHAPVFTLLKSQFYFEPSWIADTREVLSRVPEDAPVAAQNNLLPHLTTRQEVYSLPDLGNAKYVVVDFHPNQSDYNFHIGTQEEIQELVDRLVSSGAYSVDFRQGDALLLVKSH